MENEIIKMMTEFMEENRLPKLLCQDEEYQVASIREREAHDILESTLTIEQKELYESFIMSLGETQSNLVRIIYQQGMRDFYNLLRSLEVQK